VMYFHEIVITNLLSALPYIGQLLNEYEGDFLLNRSFSLHFILPLIILILVFVHLIILHLSSNPIHSKLNIYKVDKTLGGISDETKWGRKDENAIGNIRDLSGKQNIIE
ncbi:unnamed protein product, partial [Heterotrigona itama]